MSDFSRAGTLIVDAVFFSLQFSIMIYCTIRERHFYQTCFGWEFVHVATAISS